MKKIIINTLLLNDYGHSYLKALFAFPEYYGKNLDALADCLGEEKDLEITICDYLKANAFSLRVYRLLDRLSEEHSSLQIRQEADK